MRVGVVAVGVVVVALVVVILQSGEMLLLTREQQLVENDALLVPRLSSVLQNKELRQQSAINSDSIAMKAQFNQSAAMEIAFDNSLGEHTFDEMNCSEDGNKTAFLMYKTPDNMKKFLCGFIGERRVTRVMISVFDQLCHKPWSSVDNGPPPPGLMLDIGANVGYYGLMAMKKGCETLFFDLQRGCQARLNNALIVNEMTTQGRVIPFGLSSKQTSFKSPITGCSGIYPASARKADTFDQGESISQLDRLDRFVDVNQRIALVKIDTEGNEREVLEGSLLFFQKRLIDNAIVEVTPGAGLWKAIGVTQLEVATTFRTIAEAGYSMISLWDWSVYTTPDDIFQYINTVKAAKINQFDVWLTLNSALNETLVRDFKSKEEAEGGGKK